MRAREFIINIPISITMNSDGTVDVNNKETNTEPEDETDGVFVPPLQQKIELMKAGLGKQSPVIDQLLSDDEEPTEQ